jgi:2-dehydro-3-deoxyphosphogluconate aldolase/(4S)-4-hydroxy-2-oxoglutarate aldolase
VTVEAAPGAQAIAERLRLAGVVPVVSLPDAAVAVPLAEALVAGGLSCVEITFRTPAAREGLAAIRRACPDVLLGAGTVLDAGQVAQAVAAGADFLVSPATNPELVRLCVAEGVAMLPGVCTPSDVDRVLGLGLKAMKFFPAQAGGGVAFLDALHGPYPEAAFVPTGGITPDVLGDYLARPFVLACGGSWMVAPELLRTRDFDRVTRLAAEARAIVERVR